MTWRAWVESLSSTPGGALLWLEGLNLRLELLSDFSSLGGELLHDLTYAFCWNTRCLQVLVTQFKEDVTQKLVQILSARKRWLPSYVLPLLAGLKLLALTLRNTAGVISPVKPQLFLRLTEGTFLHISVSRCIPKVPIFDGLSIHFYAFWFFFQLILS